MQVWIRKLPDEHPSSVNTAIASCGFRRLGAEVTEYQDIKEILSRVSRNDIVIDGVEQLNGYFSSLGIHNNTPDYPDVLLPFAGRTIQKDRLGSLRRNFTGPIFVKPTKEKLFPGTVIRTLTDWAPLVSFPLNQEVYCSPVLDLRSEYRVFVRYDRILDVRPYLGDYHFPFDPEGLDRMLAAFTTWEQRPAGCAIDIAVTAEQKTIFLELNDACALGAYGLNPIDYALLITARWSQLLSFPDPYKTDTDGILKSIPAT